MITTKLRVLDFDIENRPLTYWADRPSAEITAIASCWVDDLTSMRVDLLGEVTSEEMLQNFIERYNQADIITGHYIRNHDLPIVNGALMEFGFPPLTPKMVCDTKVDMYKKGDIPASQEYLLDLFNVPISKRHMTQHDWRQANRLTEQGLKIVRERVESDVYGHMIMRAKMLELGLLKPVKIWRP